MKTYQVWIPGNLPLEYIDARSSFEARKTFARNNRVSVTDVCARELRPSERLSG